MINKKRLTELTRKLINIDSANPPGNELAISRLVEKDLLSLGLKVKTYCFAPRRPNVIGTLKGVFPAKVKRQSLLITPHVDTVPFGSGWRYDPLGGQIVKGRIYGRGATDDKGNLACCLEVMRSLVEDKVALKKDIIMAATVDEETSSRFGIIPLLAKRILKPDAALILDADECDTIVVQKGLIHGRVQIFGKKAHGAYNWRGINAIEIAARVIQRIKEYKFVYKAHPLLRGPTVNIGVIRGGDKVNMVADFCEFAFDLRFLPGMKPRDILKNVRQLVEKEATKFKIEIDSIQAPFEISTAHPLVKSYLEAACKIRVRSQIKGSEGATVMTFFRAYGIPAFASGYGSKGTAHTTDEYAKVDTLYRGAKLLEQFIKNYD